MWPKGRFRTQENKDKISKTLTGRKQSLETKIKRVKSREGYKHSEETKRKISLGRQGIKPSRKAIENRIESRRKTAKKYRLRSRLCSCGCNQRTTPGHPFIKGHAWRRKKHSDESRRKISRSCMGRKKSEETLKKWLRSCHMKPNRQEEKLDLILQQLFLNEYKLNVRGDLIVLGGKVPDFVNVNGKKKLIELYGDYWHRGQSSQRRINYFKTFGWDTLIIWEKELRNEEVLREKLIGFHYAN